ncbi:MAG: precorrin-8X methylmutase, partial [Methanobacteriota archaeon]
MRKGSSRQEDTTGSTYTDLGAETEEAYRISLASRTLARETVGNETPEDRVRQRCSVAVGDFSMAGLLRFVGDPVHAGLAALADGAPIVTDIRMVEVGLQKRGHRSKVCCALDYGAEIAVERGITRTSAGFLALGNTLDHAIIVIGNAPSALLAVCSLIDGG